MRRAAVSIPSNVAEGHAGGKGRRYLHHVRIALGSLAELDTQLELAVRLRLIPDDGLTAIREQVARTRQLLNGLARSLRLKQLKAAAIGSAGMALFLCLLW
jgi:four helix bundle protein